MKVEVPNFELIKQLEQRHKPLFVDDLKGLSIDYNPESDKIMKDIPTDYVCKDDNPDSASERGMESENVLLAKASI